MRLLLAEDDRELSAAIVRVLKFNKFDVDAVFDGIEALEFLEAMSYDAVILDVMMPKMDGISVVKSLRKKKNPVPVLMLTALAETDDKVNGLDSGADDYLTKPFVVKELLARIRALTRRTPAVCASYEIGNLVLDASTFELRAHESVRLTSKEYKLMELLMRNQNILLSTEKILEAVWDLDTDAEINVVWVFISSLRKKLDKIGADYTIKAVRGIGYRLEAKV